MTFGEFVRAMRQRSRLTLRDLAAKLECSAPYVNDVEKGEKKPFEKDKLEKLITIFDLSEEEVKEMYILEGKSKLGVGSDNMTYMAENDLAQEALRAARKYEATDADWLRFIEELENKRGNS